MQPRRHGRLSRQAPLTIIVESKFDRRNRSQEFSVSVLHRCFVRRAAEEGAVLVEFATVDFDRGRLLRRWWSGLVGLVVGSVVG